MRLLKSYLSFLFLLFLVSCGPGENNYKRGYGDGYAVGYNSICYPESTNIILGAWDDKKYSEGYADGHADGQADCRAN